jgi:hypothetical protein
MPAQRKRAESSHPPGVRLNYLIFLLIENNKMCVATTQAAPPAADLIIIEKTPRLRKSGCNVTTRKIVAGFSRSFIKMVVST